MIFKKNNLLIIGLLSSLFSCNALANLTIGIGTGVGSKYPGSKKSEVVPIIAFRYTLNENVYFYGNDSLGVGYTSNINDSLKLFTNLGIGYRDKRKESDDSGHFKGMGQVEDSTLLVPRIGVVYKDTFILSLGSNVAMSHRDSGNTFSIHTALALYQESNSKINVVVSGIYGDKKYNRSFFGVSSVQSQNSHHRRYKIKGGFNEIQTGLSWDYKFNDTWGIVTYVGASHLIGDAADSPIVKKETTPIASFTATYKF